MTKSPFPKKYVLLGDSPTEVYIISKDHMVPVSELRNIYNRKMFDSREEVMYEKLLSALRRGTPISNYKSSEYYQYYLHRLAEEHPEYLI